MMSAFEQRGVDRMADAAIRFANRVAELEEALQWIAKSCDVRIHRLSLFDEIGDRARKALGPDK